MATNGRINTGTLKHSYFYATWQQASQNIGDNYTDINWQVGLNCGGSNWDAWYNNAVKVNRLTINGDIVHSGTYSNISGSGDHQLASGTKRIYHDNNGSKTFNISLSGWLYDYGNTSGSENFTLNNIPRYSVISSAENFNDEGNPTIKFTNPSNGYFSLKAKIEAGGNNQLITRDLSKTATTCTFNLTEIERDKLRALCTTSNSLSVRFTICCMSGSTELSASYLDRTMTIINGNPTFSNFTYKDTNNTVTAITGNNQVLVKGLSTLQATISSSNKMIANKKATAKNYVVTIDSINKSADYSTSDLNINLGAITSSGTKRLNIRAYDSRNNSTLVYKDITVYDYNKPVINASVTRLNNFENQTTLKVSGTYSKLTINNINKNTINTLQYRYRETGGTWSTWKTLSKTVSNGKFTCSDVILSLDNTKSFDFEIQAVDKLQTNTVSLKLDIGQAIFFISSNKKACYINGQEILTYDVVDEW